MLVDRTSSSGKAGNKATTVGAKLNRKDDGDVVDKTPIVDEEASTQGGDDFGGFNDEEDEKYIDKAKKNAMRRRGLDPRALNKTKAKGKGKEGALST